MYSKSLMLFLIVLGFTTISVTSLPAVKFAAHNLNRKIVLTPAIDDQQALSEVSTLAPRFDEYPRWFHACQQDEDNRVRFRLHSPATEPTTVATMERSRAKRSSGSENIEIEDQSDEQLTTESTLHRIVTRSATTPTEPTQIVGTTTASSQDLFERRQIEDLGQKISTDNHRISWIIYNSLQKVFYARDLSKNLTLLINSSRANELDMKNVGTSWLPELKDLILKNGGSFKHESRMFLSNISHYIQFFSIGLEQMTFDNQDRNYKTGHLPDSVKILRKLRELETQTLKILCDCQKLIQLFDTIKEDSEYLLKLMNNRTGDSSPDLKVVLTSLGQDVIQDEDQVVTRLEKGKNSFLSPYILASNVKESDGNYDRVPRTVMPDHDREIKLPGRDKEILRIYWEFMDFYGHSLLML